MPDESFTPPVDDAAPADAADTPTTSADDAPKPNPFKERLDKEIAKRRAVEEQLAEFQQRVEAIEDKDKSELERAQKELARLQAKADESAAHAAELEGRVRRQERAALVRSAAEAANLLDADVAVAMVNLDDVEDDGDARKLVERLAKAKPHLVRREPDKPDLRRVYGQDGDGAADKPAAAQESLAERRKRIFSDGSDIWDPQAMIERGGGVEIVG